MAYSLDPADRGPAPDDDVEADQSQAVIETHLSRVFLTPDRAYKLLKPVTTSFVDFSRRADRLAATTQEFELNKVMSPDVYLGLADVVENGEIAERMIVMRRLPADRQLDRLADAPDFLDHVREAARLIATIHAAEPPVARAEAESATIEALAANWNDNFDALEPLAGPLVPAEEYRLVRQLVDGFLAGRATLFEERIDQGWIRDGHGDLRAEHVFCLDDGPRLIDCLAFSDDFRITDVLNDVAFLAMDLHRLASPAAAMWLVKYYDEFSNERHPAALAHHYVAYRAHVRAKIAAIRFGQGLAEAADEVTAYHRLALEQLHVGQVRLILVGGGAGVGKSTVAGGLADALGCTLLRSDEIRKDLAGMAYDEHAFVDAGTGIYSPEFTDRVYREMLREAELLLARGESVVLDGSWSSDARRQWARDLAGRLSATISEIHCSAPLAVAKERIARRMASLHNPSDATPEIADHLAAHFDRWPEAVKIDTKQSVAGSIEDACSRVMAGVRDGADAPSAKIDEAALNSETVEFFLTRITAWHRRRISGS